MESLTVPMDETHDLFVTQLHDGRLAIATHQYLYIYSLKGEMQFSTQHCECKPWIEQPNRDMIVYASDNDEVTVMPMPHYIRQYSARLDRLSDISISYH